uniref:Uncharacterized protein n=1 Tax=Caenorhabditis japonica TaxID=281687 RepID=A0A8R1ITD4_CAEJA
MWKAFDEEAERSDRYTRTAYFDEEFRSQSGSSTKRKRNSFQKCLRWDSMKKFQARLMKEGKPDEYTTEEVWNFQLTDSP